MRDGRAMWLRVAVLLAVLSVPALAGPMCATSASKATARAGDIQLDFVRVDGRWYELMPPAGESGAH